MAQNLKMLQEKHDQWVLETVDCLRQRKARPDLQRISRMMERFHGLTANETRESLERLSNDGVVMKVHFKGNISYRHVKRCSGDQSNSNYYNTSIRIAQAIKSIMLETGDSASFGDIETWLISKNPETRLVKHRLQTALNREIESRTVTRLSDKTYVLTDLLPKSKTSAGETSKPKLEEKKSDNRVPKKKEALQPNKVETTTNQSVKSAESQDDKVTKETDESPLKRSRPLSKRKKFKKTHGPDFETPGKLRKCVTKDEDGNSTPVCGYCSKTAESNNEGKEEPLLTCKDCDAKAHPSCMDYSPDLARRALNSPWQCMDCKTCFLCEGSENADLMLFCDACDKGYHMICHEPPLNNKPKGKWICSICQDEMETEKKKQGQLEKSNKNNEKKGAVKGNKDNENTDDNQSKKRKLSRQKSLPLAKRVKTSPSTSDDSQSQTSSQNLQESFTDFTKGTCLPTPSASPKPSDTFDYEMKMSQLGFPVSIIEDNTTYSDATHWNTDDVVKFFEGCGFKENAQAFKEQEIDGRSLLLMQRNDVLTGLGLKLGPALKIYHKVVKLQFYSQSSNV